MPEEQVLSIAGSDSGAGAGAQADLKTFSALNTYGTTVITSVTSQNTIGVQDIHEIPATHVKSQINSVLTDFNIKAIKIGMLYSKEIMEAVSSCLNDYNRPIVLDPVMISESGDLLISKDALEYFKNELIPQASLITPNKDEAQEITGKKIEDKKDIKEVLDKIKDLGCENVVITGGHLDGNDYLLKKNKIEIIEGEKLDIKSHGSGCTYSSAIAAYLAKDNELSASIKKAKSFTEEAIKSRHMVGKGENKPVNQYKDQKINNERYIVLRDIREAINKLGPGFSELIPEVGSNIGMAIKDPETIKDVAAVPGRIVSKNKGFEVVDCPWFGASSHVARLILTINSFYPEKRAAMNIKYQKRFIEKFKEAGYHITSFDRRNVPEKDTMSYGTREAINNTEEVADIIYDEGDIGKEPMIRVIGETATRVVKKIRVLL